MSGTDPSQCNSTKWQSPPSQQNRRNFWTKQVILIAFKNSNCPKTSVRLVYFITGSPIFNCLGKVALLIPGKNRVTSLLIKLMTTVFVKQPLALPGSAKYPWNSIFGTIVARNMNVREAREVFPTNIEEKQHCIIIFLFVPLMLEGQAQNHLQSIHLKLKKQILWVMFWHFYINEKKKIVAFWWCS